MGAAMGTALRIVHVLQDTAHGNLSFDDLAAGGRGVTGSEQAMLYLAKAQAEIGHRIICYWPTDKPGFSNGVEIRNFTEEWPRLRRMDTADVVISWLSSDPLRNAPEQAVRILSIQINDWLLNAPDFDRYVDGYVSVSNTHRDFVWTLPGAPPCPPGKIHILPNGVDLARFRYPVGERIPNRCVYLSSPDRGLHWVLAMWPEIRFAYPTAEFHIFYEVQKWLEGTALLNSDVGRRAVYCVDRLKRLGPHGAGVRGAISPQELAGELSKADVMLYPCDTVRFTEGFGVAVLDAMAAGVVPIITDCDAFGEIYSDSGAIVVPRGTGRSWTDTYLETVLRALSNRDDLELRRKRVQEFVQQYDWPIVAQHWEDTIHKVKEAKHGTA